MTKLVVRLFDESGVMLGVIVHHAALLGDGALRASSPMHVVADVGGTPVRAHAHWCDPNVGIELPFPTETRVKLEQGDTLKLYERGDVIAQIGPVPVNLPPIVVRATSAIAVPVGGLGARP